MFDANTLLPIIDKRSIEHLSRVLENPEGGFFLLAHKPPGPSSFQLAREIKYILGIKKIGHSGTLDPLAAGLMILAAGRPATKEIDRYIKLEKTYEATITVGHTTPSYDLETEPIYTGDFSRLTEEEINGCLKKFLGETSQTPPMFSAIKKDGMRLYQLARKGIAIDVPERKIFIRKISLIKVDLPDVTFEVECSSGAYIRTLANDIGKKLGCGAYLKRLARTHIAAFRDEDALDTAALKRALS